MAWPGRRVAIAVWLATTASVVLAALAAALMFAAPVPALHAGVAGLADACVESVRQAYQVSDDRSVHAAALILAAAIVARVGYAFAARTVNTARNRRRHRALLSAVGQRAVGTDLSLVPSQAATAYCIPGRPSLVVVTTGAVGLLSAGELAAVLDHETAHVRGRHHWLTAAASGLGRALPWLPLFRAAPSEVAVLVEFLADDRAVSKHSPATVISALLAMAPTALTPAGALGAGATALQARVLRLAGRQVTLATRAKCALLVGSVCLLSLPPLLFLAPAFSLVHFAFCPLPVHAIF